MVRHRVSTKSGFRHFFIRGLAIVLPSILTIWILFVAYQFVQNRIAGPINTGIREVLIRAPWPVVSSEQLEEEARTSLQGEDLAGYMAAHAKNRPAWLRRHVRRNTIERWWSQSSLLLDLFGLIVAILLIYSVGAVLGSFIGRRLYARGEEMISKVPLIKQVYPSVKQVTDFLFGPADESKRMRFSRVVAVEYPRKGLWSVGLVTGTTMRAIQARAGKPSLTVFIPSSPTPFTGYVITVPQEDTIDLNITTEEALRFAVSAGVIVPPSQMIETAEPPTTVAPAASEMAQIVSRT
jgi:uncharacterized membrane protein